jgi:abequosyltransferase
MKPILSILIPTFNRALYLERLLSELESQLRRAQVGCDVEVLIGDNASHDSTREVLEHFCSKNPYWVSIGHSKNLGAEANIVELLARASGVYCWIIGDDDLPRSGLLCQLLEALQRNSPSLVYLPSKWAADISTIQQDSINAFQFRQTTCLEWAKKHHIWTTFLSSWVFSVDQLLNGLSSIKAISTSIGSNLVQLGWILPLLVSPQSKIFVVDSPCILATSGNTGGYAILRTFVVNYPNLVHAHTRDLIRVRMALIGMAVRHYMPSLIVSVRFSGSHRDPGDSSGILLDSLKVLWCYPSYWMVCLPLLLCPAWFFKLLSKLRGIAKQVFRTILAPPSNASSSPICRG